MQVARTSICLSCHKARLVARLKTSTIHLHEGEPLGTVGLARRSHGHVLDDPLSTRSGNRRRWVGYIGPRLSPYRPEHWQGRHGPERPKIGWSYPVGGSLAESQINAADVDGDGRREAIVVSGGRISARRADDTVAWNSDGIGALRVVGVRPRAVAADAERRGKRPAPGHNG